MPDLPTHWLVSLGLLTALGVGWWASALWPALRTARRRDMPLLIVVGLGSGALVVAIGALFGVGVVRALL